MHLSKNYNAIGTSNMWYGKESNRKIAASEQMECMCDRAGWLTDDRAKNITADE